MVMGLVRWAPRRQQMRGPVRLSFFLHGGVAATAEGAEGPPDTGHPYRSASLVRVWPWSDRRWNTVFAGIVLLEADDFQMWKLSIEVLGNTVYQVRRAHICSRFGPE